MPGLDQRLLDERHDPPEDFVLLVAGLKPDHQFREDRAEAERRPDGLGRRLPLRDLETGRPTKLVEQILRRALDPADPVADDARGAKVDLWSIVDQAPQLEEVGDDTLLVLTHHRVGHRRRQTEGGVDPGQVDGSLAE